MSKKLQAQFGPSVRTFFEQDLKKIKEKFICLLPEWICFDMTKIAYMLKIPFDFYSTKSFTSATSPFELDIHDVNNKIINYKNHYNKIILILAHPMGYYDKNIDSVLKKINYRSKNDPIIPILDLSQGYGIIDPSKQIELSYCAYVSFNGNKLLNFGGALRIDKQNDISNSIYFEFLKIAYNKAIDQKIMLKKTLKRIECYLKKSIEKPMQRFLKKSTRTSAHRTVITLNSLNSKDIELLETLKFGQKIHPNPQFNLAASSRQYKSWSNEVFLIFPKQRL